MDKEKEKKRGSKSEIGGVEREKERSTQVGPDCSSLHHTWFRGGSVNTIFVSWFIQLFHWYLEYFVSLVRMTIFISLAELIIVKIETITYLFFDEVVVHLHTAVHLFNFTNTVKVHRAFNVIVFSRIGIKKLFSEFFKKQRKIRQEKAEKKMWNVNLDGPREVCFPLHTYTRAACTPTAYTFQM